MATFKKNSPTRFFDVIPPRVGWKRFFRDLWQESLDDNITNGAAALAYYLTLSIFPALIFLLSLVPFLPLGNVDMAVMDFLREILPNTAADMLSGVVQEITSHQKEGLLSFGLLGTLWAASNGTYAVMQGVNTSYDVEDTRAYWRVRLLSLGLTLILGTLFLVSFVLIVLGGHVESWLTSELGSAQQVTRFAFRVLRWGIIFGATTTALAVAYYWGPDVKQDFRFITPGSLLGTLLISLASLLMRFYVTRFADYEATYGSLGAVIALMLWLYVAGIILLLGSEVNALLEDYSPSGKDKGQHQ